MSEPAAALSFPRVETISEEFAKYLMEKYRPREDDSPTLAVLGEILAAIKELNVLLTKPPPSQAEIDALNAKVASLAAALSGSTQQLEAAMGAKS